MISETQKRQMRDAVAEIRAKMADAARAAGRDPKDVLLCAACKTRTVEEVRYSADLPIDLFGENHVQELVEKTDAAAYNGKPGHFIGHLQTNKVNKVVGRAALIQSVDSTRLAKADAQHYDRAQMDILSMGMSGDYTAAIAEGATLVRIGTAIYGARDYSKKA